MYFQCKVRNDNSKTKFLVAGKAHTEATNLRYESISTTTVTLVFLVLGVRSVMVVYQQD